ncbi:MULTISPECIES: LysR family transcriptional regulator [unclassified Variovorax]|uniref:LysR family transcriptional regulator n=1 Tax=unclassified Variovorax TaxID=663243 RepID=UPI003F45DD47
MINLKHIEVFHAIMRTGSVTGAARMLNVTQPAISSVLKHLESRLRMKLFDRTGGRLQPTPEAHALMPDVAGIFGRLEAIERLTQDLAGGRLGTLSIAASSPIANGRLARLVADLLAERPGTQISLQALASPLVLDRVANREAEIGIAYAPVMHPEVSAEVLGHNEIGCVMRSDHPLASRAEVHVRELADHPLITYLPQALMRPYIDRAFHEAGVLPNIAVQVGLSITGMALAYQGAGVALVELELLDALPLPGLVARPLLPRIELETLLLLHKTAPRSRMLEHFLAQLRSAFTQR